jgi:hypothetical protein
MSQQALLARVTGALEGAGIPFMVSGSLASSLQGEPRSTHDIDLVIDVAAADAARLLGALSAPDLYVDPIALTDAVREQRMFNLLDPATGDKVDFWLLTDDPYDAARFARRGTVEALGMRFSVSTPEDTILMKLRWAHLSGGSEKQYRDALGVYEVQAGALDHEYLHTWAAVLGVEDALDQIVREAEPLED